MKNLLVTGASGQLGHFVKKILAQSPTLLSETTFVNHNEMDMSSPASIDNFFKQQGRFKFALNLGAYTQVDKAEDERDLAWQINAHAPAQIASYCDSIVHISTDYVFDGEKTSPYTENDKAMPLSVYGESKHVGEVKLLQSHAHGIVVRTSWLYSELPGNFLTKILNFAKERPELKIVSDQRGTPTYAGDLAKVLVRMVQNGAAPGIYHYSNEGETTWYDFAKYFVGRQKISTPINPIQTSEFKTAARRPHYAVLDKSKIKREMNLQIAPWQESVNICLKNLS